MNYTKNILLRLTIAILLGMFFKVFYIIFSPLTFGLSKLTINWLGYETVVAAKDLLIVNGFPLRFVNACTAASAYYLLILLILLTKGIRWRDIVFMFISGSFIILVMNLIRIDLLVYILLNFGIDQFETIHLFFWKVVSTIFVALTWIFLIKKFNVKGIPVYSDFKYIYRLIKKRKKI